MKRVLKDVTIAAPRKMLRPASSMTAQGVAAAAAEPKGMATRANQDREASEAELRQQVAQARRAAEQAGYAAGLEQGQAAGRTALQARADELARLIQTLRQAHAQQRLAWEDLGAEFAFAVACRMLGERAVTRAGIEGAVCQVMAEAGAQRPLTLRLHPQDLAAVSEALAHGVLDAGADAPQLKADAAVELGGCLIDTPRGTLDGRLETQLQALARAVNQARAERQMQGIT